MCSYTPTHLHTHFSVLWQEILSLNVFDGYGISLNILGLIECFHLSPPFTRCDGNITLVILTGPSKTDGVTPFTFNMYFSLQGKGRLRRGNYPCPSSPAVVRLPSMSDVTEETLTSEVALETDITEQQQAAMQQEERVLTEQIENLQKEK